MKDYLKLAAIVAIFILGSAVESHANGNRYSYGNGARMTYFEQQVVQEYRKQTQVGRNTPNPYRKQVQQNRNWGHKYIQQPKRNYR